MPKYLGYLLAAYLSVWVGILAYSLRTWLRERKILSESSPARGEAGS